MAVVETELVTAYYQRLAGADAHAQALTHNNNVVPVFTGNAPTDKEAPYVIVGRPRSRGQETLDGVSHPEVRLQLRIHTAHNPGQGDHFKCYEIADAAHELLEAVPITVDGHEPYVPEPDKTPIPSYDKGDQEALDLSVQYTFPSI